MSAHSEKFVTDVKVLMNDTEALVKATASHAGDRIVEIRDRAQNSVSHLKPRLAAVETELVDKAKSSAAATNAYVKQNPWPAMGLSAGIGLVIGLLISRQ